MKKKNNKHNFKAVLLLLLILVMNMVYINHYVKTTFAASEKNSNMLTECIPYYLEDSTIEDKVVIGGVTYNDALKVSLDSDSHMRRIGFNLQNKYSDLSFEIGHIDGTGTANGNIVLGIYKDGELFESYDLFVNDLAKKISCDVVGVSQFEIVITYDYYTGVKGFFGIGAMNFERSGEKSSNGQVIDSTFLSYCLPYMYQNCTLNKTLTMGGITYNNAINVSLESDSKRRTIAFNLQEMYEQIKFCIGHVDGTGLANNNIVLSLYGDGKLIESYNLNVNDIPKAISCDTVGVSKFEMIVDYNYITGVKGSFGIGALKGISIAAVESLDIDKEGKSVVKKQSIITGKLKLTSTSKTSSDILSYEVSDIKWTSSDQSIVPDSEISCTGVNSYDNHSSELLISFTPHKKGKVTITGKTSNGLTASCDVIIEELIAETKTTPTEKPTVVPSDSMVCSSQQQRKMAKVTGLSVKKQKKNINVTWKKVFNVKGYQISYSVSRKFKKDTKLLVRGNKVTIKKLKSGKTYYIRVRAYSVDGSRKVYGKWSDVVKKKYKK